MGPGAGVAALGFRAKGQRKPSFQEREACGGLGAAMVAGLVTACVGVAGAGKEGGGPLGDRLSETRPTGDHNASQNCSTEEKR